MTSNESPLLWHWTLRNLIRYIYSFVLIGEEDAPLESEDANSEKKAHSEKLFHEFMKSSEAKDLEIAKEEVSRIRNGKVRSFLNAGQCFYHIRILSISMEKCKFGLKV